MLTIPPVSGLLVSQIGYDLSAPMRAIYRGPRADVWPADATFSLSDAENGAVVLQAPLMYWGECWRSHWWIANFSELKQPGSYRLALETAGVETIESSPFVVGRYRLWDAAVRPVGIDQFEARAERARFGNGWKDCGAGWREASSHSAALIGLLDLLYIGFEWLGRADAQRLAQQVMHGCDFLVLCQKRAADLGLPPGALIHELPESAWAIPQDLGQAVVALARAARYLYEVDAERSNDYLRRAVASYEYLTRRCAPGQLPNFSPLLHGAPEGYQPASFMTNDLLMMLWGAVELARSGRPQYLNEAADYAREILRRQVKQGESESGLYGHFFAFADRLFTEKAFIHHHVGHDTGMMFSHYIVPLIELCNVLPDHADAPLWRGAIRDFAYGYFLPACRKNPFLLLPQGDYAGQGVLTFCGPWHGFNVCYGYAATTAIFLEMFLDDRQFRDIAVGNLQWVAGLNSGITDDVFEGSVIWREDVPAGQALPYSHIHGIGERSVKTWSKIVGSIGNGFCTNRQFHMEVEPTAENDGPWRYSDEDWIPHAGGWVSGLTYLRQVMTWAIEEA